MTDQFDNQGVITIFCVEPFVKRYLLRKSLTSISLM
jgi:hypothetical protein